MNLEFFFNALTGVWGLGEILIIVLTRTRRGEGKIQDRGTQIILLVVIVASLKINEWMHGWFPIDMPGSHSWLLPAAFMTLLLGLGVRAVAIVTHTFFADRKIDLRTPEVYSSLGLHGDRSQYMTSPRVR